MRTDPVVSTIESKIREYQKEHRGERPLYVLLNADAADKFAEAIRQRKKYDEKVPVTEYEGTHIVRDPAMKEGQILLTNELPGD